MSGRALVQILIEEEETSKKFIPPPLSRGNARVVEGNKSQRNNIRFWRAEKNNKLTKR